MMYWNWGLWGLIGMLFMIVFWAAVIFGIVMLVRWLTAPGRHPGYGPGSGEPDALEILRRRYARGEINKEEYEARKKDLE